MAGAAVGCGAAGVPIDCRWPWLRMLPRLQGVSVADMAGEAEIASSWRGYIVFVRWGFMGTFLLCCAGPEPYPCVARFGDSWLLLSQVLPVSMEFTRHREGGWLVWAVGYVGGSGSIAVAGDCTVLYNCLRKGRQYSEQPCVVL